MEAFRQKYAMELKNLEISNVEDISKRIVTTKFRRKALLVHSDKTRKDDEEFKELLNDYRKVMDALDLIENDEDNSDVKTDLQEFFKNHNLVKEFSQSWTIFIEKEKIFNR